MGRGMQRVRPAQAPATEQRPGVPDRRPGQENSEVLDELLQLGPDYTKPGHQAFGNGAGDGGKGDSGGLGGGGKGDGGGLGGKTRRPPGKGARPPQRRSGGGPSFTDLSGEGFLSSFCRPTQAFGNGAGNGDKQVLIDKLGKK